MKKSIVNKMTAGVLTAFVLTSSAGTAALAAEKSEIMPLNIAITQMNCDLEMSSTGVMDCWGYTSVQSGKKAGVTVELQKSTSGGWDTVKTWNKTGSMTVSVDEYHTVSKGTYQLKVTHKAYNSAGTLIESIVQYSDTVVYN